NAKKEKENIITNYENEITKCEKERTTISKELQEKQQTSGLIKEIETYKASIGSKSQILTDKGEEIKKISTNLTECEKLKNKAEREVERLQEEIKKLKNELKDSESKLPNYKKSKTAESLDSLEGEIKNQQSLLQKARERLIALETDAKLKKELLETKIKELEELSKSTEQKVQKENETDDEIESLRKDLSTTNREIEDSFKLEKELNSDSAESDKRLLELREKYSVLRMQAAPALANPALKSIAELKESGSIIGIHGIVADLIKFDSRYTAAVEAAAGPRLLYVVVDSADVASKIIKHLKKSGAGRATFIPLREIKKGQLNNPTKNPILSNLVSYSKVVSSAIDYVFGETILVESMDEAKKIGVGNIRMVTLEGEIFEKSGIISGGRVGTSILAATQLSKLEAEINEIKEGKNHILKELTYTREDASRKRSFKAELELKIKTLELEAKAEQNEGKLEEIILNKVNDLKIETTNIQSEIKRFDIEVEKVNLEKTKYEEKLYLLEAKLKESIEKAKELSDTENKMITELSSSISSLRAVIEGKNKEMELVRGELSRIESDIKHENLEKKNALEKINETKKLIQKDSEELAKCEQQISAHSKKIEKLFENLKRFDESLRSLAEKKTKVKIELDKVTKESSQYEIKKATLETRLQDTKAEFSNFKEFDFIELSKDELQKRIKQAEQLIEVIGNVNMMAIEMYDKKKIEVDELKEKIGTLESERSAVLQMITEIDHKKNEAFFETFYAVSDNFKSMFSKISIGEGFLYLDKPNDPFESGLYIKIKRNSREHNLDSLSGGENTLVALMFIFALQFFKPSPFYILDEVEAALDKENSKNLAKLIKQMAGRTQFILVSHNDNVMATADSVLGVTKVDGHSRIVGIKLEQMVIE
ncbi:hypothetical protein HYT84_03565, partial [Candidatus Micrarchaeota archaeon]|nr:hypothetical protein [Candidatus Micrarchaeota archaeon]